MSDQPASGRYAEKVLFGLVTELSSVEELILSGFKVEWIPSAELRPIYEWAIHQYKISGNLFAPTPKMFMETEAPGYGGKSYGEVLYDNGIIIDEVPDEPVSWVIETLRSRELTKRTEEFVTDLSEEILAAPHDKRAEIFGSHIAEGVQIHLGQQTKRNVFELQADGEDIITEYERRAADVDAYRGLQLGLPEVDAHMHGLYEGELMVVSAPPKGSKSYMIARIALKEFELGRKVALFTLENSIDMMRDRIACLATGVHPQRFEQGNCTEAEEAAVREWVKKLGDGQGHLFIIQPPLGSRTAETMISEAQIRGVDSVLIDQLTFVDAPDPKATGPQKIRDIMHTIKALISTGPHKMPCVLTHQLTRDGIKVAKKTGHLEMYDLAEGSEAEKTADWVFSMWQSEDAKQVGQFLFQILASRRRDRKHWLVNWDIESGHMSVYGEADLSA